MKTTEVVFKELLETSFHERFNKNLILLIISQKCHYFPLIAFDLLLGGKIDILTDIRWI